MATDRSPVISTLAISELFLVLRRANIATGADSSFVGTVDTNRLAFRTNNIERMSISRRWQHRHRTKNTHGYQLACQWQRHLWKVR